jgi:hypothetical protein
MTSPWSKKWARAFTLTEMLVTVSILMMVMAAMITAHIFGLRFFEITKAKLVASDDARRSVSRLITEIRGAKMIMVGTGTVSSFTEVADGALQQGSAIQLYGTTNTNTFVRYFWNVSDGKLKRTTNGSTVMNLMASSITNSIIFTAEDFKGNILTNNENNRVVGLTLKFRQLEFPVINIGPSNYYNFYQLRTKITRRTLE